MIKKIGSMMRMASRRVPSDLAAIDAVVAAASGPTRQLSSNRSSLRRAPSGRTTTLPDGVDGPKGSRNSVDGPRGSGVGGSEAVSRLGSISNGRSEELFKFEDGFNLAVGGESSSGSDEADEGALARAAAAAGTHS